MKAYVFWDNSSVSNPMVSALHKNAATAPASKGQRVAMAFVAAAVIGGCGNGREEEASPPPPAPFLFMVETLSRGKGVPDVAREALGKSIRILELEKEGGRAATWAESRIGLEGETRLNVEFADPKVGREVYARICELAEGVDLFTVKEVRGESGQTDD